MKRILIIAILLYAASASAQDKKQLEPKDEVILRLRKSLMEAQVDNVQLRYQMTMARLRAEYKALLAELGEEEPPELKEAK